MRSAARFLPLLLLFGCGFGADALSKLVPAHADRYGRDYLALVARGEIDSAELKLPAEIPHDTARRLLAFLHERFKGATLDSAVIVGAQVNSSVMGDGTVEIARRIGYLIPTDRTWTLFVVAMEERGGVRHLTGFHFDTFSADPRVTSAFTFTGKGAGYYLFVVVEALCLVMALVTATWVARQKGLPKRWLWVFVALIGVGTVSLDWSTGDYSQRMFNFLLFSAGAIKGGPIDPWVLSLAFPAGAFAAIARVSKWRRGVDPAPDAGRPEVASIA